MKRPERALDRHAHDLAELALHRPRVVGHLARDRGDDLVGQRGQHGPQDVRGVGGDRGVGPGRRRHLSRGYRTARRNAEATHKRADRLTGTMQAMTRAHKLSNLIGAIVPFLAFIAAIVLLWNEYVGWTDLAVLAIMYVITGLGITIGYHRLLTHRSFQTYKPVEYLFATLGSMAVQGPVIAWVADHRKHHAHTDEEGDPHSPARRPRRRHPGRAARALVRAHGLAVRRPRPRGGQAVRAATSSRTAACASSAAASSAIVLRRPADPGRPRLPAHRHAQGRDHRPGLGRLRAHLHAPPRHLVDQLGVPLLRPPALRRRGPLDQRVLARAAVVRRVLAPQPPRLPALRRAWPEVVGGRPVRGGRSAR